MNKLRKRKFNTYYWTCIVIAVCLLILSNLEWNTIFGGFMGTTLLPFYTLDERGKCVFEEGESND
jgi:hypothetical protein|nr:MAG TPA: hypothetical protein [Siphoviridae sp. ct3an14]